MSRKAANRRGVCPGCWRTVAIIGNGVMSRHAGVVGLVGTCPASGEPWRLRDDPEAQEAAAQARHAPRRCHLDAGTPIRLCMRDMGHDGECDPLDPCDMGALLRAAIVSHRADHPGTSQAAIARRAGIDPASLSRAFGRPDAEPATVRAVCRALGLRVALVPV